MSEPVNNRKDSDNRRGNGPSPRDELHDEVTASLKIVALSEVSTQHRMACGVTVWQPKSNLELMMFEDLRARVRTFAAEALAESVAEGFNQEIKISRVTSIQPLIHKAVREWNVVQGEWQHPLDISCHVEARDISGGWLLLTAEGIERFNAPVSMDAWVSNDPDYPLGTTPRYSFRAFTESWENLKRSRGDPSLPPSYALTAEIEMALEDWSPEGVIMPSVEIVSYEFSEELGQAIVTTTSGLFKITCSLDDSFGLDIQVIPAVPHAEILRSYLDDLEGPNKDCRRVANGLEERLAQNQREKLVEILTESIKDSRVNICLAEPRLVVENTEGELSSYIVFMCVLTDNDGNYYLLNRGDNVERYDHPVACSMYLDKKSSDYFYRDLYSKQAFEVARLKAIAALRENRIPDSEVALTVVNEIAECIESEPSEVNIAHLEETAPDGFRIEANGRLFKVSLKFDDSKVGVTVLQLPRLLESAGTETQSVLNTSEKATGWLSGLVERVRRLLR